MKLSLPIFALALLAFFHASAQVSVDVSLDQKQFLPGEPLPVAVHITNRSGQPLHLGADLGWLTFSVEAADGFIVVKNADAPVLGEFDLGSSEVATKHVNLAPYFILNHAGRYRVIATVHIKQWNLDVTSPPKKFDVISGVELWSQNFGVPGATNQAPDVRKYTLLEANYLASELRLYAQVTDESESRVFKVVRIGQLVSFSQPEEQLDRYSNLHVLWQSGASSFTYAVINPDGDIERTETYDYVKTHPRLGTNDDGDIVVIGGVRRLKPDEIPVVKSPDEMPAPAKQ
jgi:hypothetical protein